MRLLVAGEPRWAARAGECGVMIEGDVARLGRLERAYLAHRSESDLVGVCDGCLCSLALGGERSSSADFAMRAVCVCGEDMS